MVSWLPNSSMASYAVQANASDSIFLIHLNLHTVLSSLIHNEFRESHSLAAKSPHSHLPMARLWAVCAPLPAALLAQGPLALLPELPIFSLERLDKQPCCAPFWFFPWHRHFFFPGAGCNDGKPRVLSPTHHQRNAGTGQVPVCPRKTPSCSLSMQAHLSHMHAE